MRTTAPNSFSYILMVLRREAARLRRARQEDDYPTLWRALYRCDILLDRYLEAKER